MCSGQMPSLQSSLLHLQIDSHSERACTDDCAGSTCPLLAIQNGTLNPIPIPFDAQDSVKGSQTASCRMSCIIASDERVSVETRAVHVAPKGGSFVSRTAFSPLYFRRSNWSGRLTVVLTKP